MKKVRFKAILLPFAYFFYLGLCFIVVLVFQDFFDILFNPERSFGGVLNILSLLVYIFAWISATYFVLSLSREVFKSKSLT